MGVLRVMLDELIQHSVVELSLNAFILLHSIILSAQPHQLHSLGLTLT